MKKVNLNCPVDEAFASAVDEHLAATGRPPDRAKYIRTLLQADMDGAVGRQSPQELLRTELTAAVFVILSAMGRVGTSESARKLADAFHSGAFHQEKGGDS